MAASSQPQAASESVEPWVPKRVILPQNLSQALSAALRQAIASEAFRVANSGDVASAGARARTPKPVEEVKKVQEPPNSHGATASTNRTAGKAPQPILAVGERVMYWSTTHKKWIKACILSLNPDLGDGVTYNLDCKTNVESWQLRRGNEVSSEALRPPDLSETAGGGFAIGMPVQCWNEEQKRWLEGVISRRYESGGAIVFDVTCHGAAFLQVTPANLKHNRYQVGDVVEYFSSSANRWLPARVKRLAFDKNTCDLDIKKNAPMANIRRVEVVEEAPAPVAEVLHTQVRASRWRSSRAEAQKVKTQKPAKPRPEGIEAKSTDSKNQGDVVANVAKLKGDVAANVAKLKATDGDDNESLGFDPADLDDDEPVFDIDDFDFEPGWEDEVLVDMACEDDPYGTNGVLVDVPPTIAAPEPRRETSRIETPKMKLVGANHKKKGHSSSYYEDEYSDDGLAVPTVIPPTVQPAPRKPALVTRERSLAARALSRPRNSRSPMPESYRERRPTREPLGRIALEQRRVTVRSASPRRLPSSQRRSRNLEHPPGRGRIPLMERRQSSRSRSPRRGQDHRASFVDRGRRDRPHESRRLNSVDRRRLAPRDTGRPGRGARDSRPRDKIRRAERR